MLEGSPAGRQRGRMDSDHSTPTTAPNLNLLLATVALAIGMQSGAMVQLKIPGIVTTYITGTWTTMLSGLVRLARQRREQTPAQNLDLSSGCCCRLLSCRYIFSPRC